MRGSRIPPLARKELRHILRDPRSLWIVFMLPNVMMFLFGYAIDLDLTDIRVGVCDLSATPQSRALVDAIDASSYFTVAARCEDPGETSRLFERRVIRAGVIVPRDFARTLERERRATVGLVVDGSDANSASIVQNYLETFLALWREDERGEEGNARGGGGRGSAPLIGVRPTVFYNRTLDSTNYIVPGLVAIVMMMLGALLTSVTIAREKETGTMEQILVSPIKPFEVIAGKVLPYLVIAFVIAMIIVTVGHFWFKVPFVGSVGALMFYCLLYLFAALALGILISTLVSTQQVAIMLSLMVTLLPSVMLSGFIFPVASMPHVLRFVSYAIPATHFLVIVRGVMLKGNVLADLWPQVAALGGISIVLTILAVKRFSMKLGGKGGRA
jgi:ABC-2 type transport system permease protein